MSILAWLAVGLAIGLVVGWVSGRRRSRLAGDGAVGVLGAILGGFLTSVLLGLDVVGVQPVGLISAVVGAGLVLVVAHALPVGDVLAD